MARRSVSGRTGKARRQVAFRDPAMRAVEGVEREAQQRADTSTNQTSGITRKQRDQAP